MAKLEDLKKQIIDKITAATAGNQSKRLSLKFKRSSSSQSLEEKSVEAVQVISAGQSIREIHQGLLNVHVTFTASTEPEKEFSNYLLNLCQQLQKDYPDEFVEKSKERTAGLDGLRRGANRVAAGTAEAKADQPALVVSNDTTPTSPLGKFRITAIMQNDLSGASLQQESRHPAFLASVTEGSPINTPIATGTGTTPIPFKLRTGTGTRSRPALQSRAEEAASLAAAQDVVLARKNMQAIAREILQYSVLETNAVQAKISLQRALNAQRREKGEALLETISDDEVNVYLKQMGAIDLSMCCYLVEYFHTEHGLEDMLQFVETEFHHQRLVLPVDKTNFQFESVSGAGEGDQKIALKITCQTLFKRECHYETQTFQFEGDQPKVVSSVILEKEGGGKIKAKDLSYALLQGDSILPVQARKIFTGFFESKRRYDVLAELRQYYYSKPHVGEEDFKRAREGLTFASNSSEGQGGGRTRRWLGFRRKG